MLNTAPAKGPHRAAERITDLMPDRGGARIDGATDMAALVATRGQAVLMLVLLYLLWSMARLKTKLARVTIK